MKTIKLHFVRFFALTSLSATIFGCGNNASTDSIYSIAPQEYAQLTEQYLQHLANFEWEESYRFLSDNVEFKLPDGDTDTRTTFKGLDNVKEYWNTYPQNSGNTSTVLKNFVHVPVQANQMVENVGVTGVFDICYFSAELTFASGKANVRMHWALHFDDKKKIDGIYTYFDRTPITNAAKKNFLETESR